MMSTNPSEALESAVRPHPDTEAPSAPEVWTVAVLRVMSRADTSLTLGEIEREVGREVAVAGPAPIEEEVAILQKYDFVTRDDVSGHYSLSEQGSALVAGIDRDSRS